MARTLTRAELAAKVEREELRLLMGDRKFRRFMWRLLGKSGMWARSHRSTEADTSFAEGRRDLGNELLTDLRLAQADALPLILAEFPAGLPGFTTGELEPDTPGDPDEDPA